jgi:hypothetical protein
VTTAAFVPLPFERELALRAPLLDDRADELRLPDPELRLRDEAELRLRDEAAEERRLEALALLGLLREAEDLLSAFELREFVCLLFEERVLPWAITPP